MFDTHCHLNFKAFKKNLPDVARQAADSGVTDIVIPGTDVKTSRRGVELASENDCWYAAVGIHPHHAYKLIKNKEISIMTELDAIETLISHSKVVAVGEIGMDRHEYGQTVYETYVVDDTFIEIQKELLKKQIELAKKYHKSLIFHNREAKDDMLPILRASWSADFANRSVFHCCEPDREIYEFAVEHQMFLGVDGDITYYPEKQEFIKNVPLEMLVLETDSPFLLPEPQRTAKMYPNRPSNVAIVAEWVAKLKGIDLTDVIETTSANGKRLFGIV